MGGANEASKRMSQGTEWSIKNAIVCVKKRAFSRVHRKGIFELFRLFHIHIVSFEVICIFGCGCVGENWHRNHSVQFYRIHIKSKGAVLLRKHYHWSDSIHWEVVTFAEMGNRTIQFTCLSSHGEHCHWRNSVHPKEREIRIVLSTWSHSNKKTYVWILELMI